MQSTLTSLMHAMIQQGKPVACCAAARGAAMRAARASPPATARLPPASTSSWECGSWWPLSYRLLLPGFCFLVSMVFKQFWIFTRERSARQGGQDRTDTIVMQVSLLTTARPARRLGTGRVRGQRRSLEEETLVDEREFKHICGQACLLLRTIRSE